MKTIAASVFIAGLAVGLGWNGHLMGRITVDLLIVAVVWGTASLVFGLVIWPLVVNHWRRQEARRRSSARLVLLRHSGHGESPRGGQSTIRCGSNHTLRRNGLDASHPTNPGSSRGAPPAGRVDQARAAAKP